MIEAIEGFLRRKGQAAMASGDPQVETIQRAVRGDAVALTLLLTRSRRDVCGYVARHVPADLRGALDADDVVQEAHAEAFRHIADFEPRGADSFDRWVKTIALRKLRDAIKMRRADKRGGGNIQVHAASPGLGESVAMLLDLMVGSEQTPSRCVASGEAITAVRAAMHLLPDDYQEAVSLIYIQGLSVNEAAARMNRTDRAVHNLCHKAKARLRELLETQSRFLSGTG
jgi:RNA polymerase sigma-70 factor, ECF subfamily